MKFLLPRNMIFIYNCTYSKNAYNMYPKAAITSTSTVSARFGRHIFEQGGSVADCAIAVLLCAGVRNPERMGIGGGFVLSYYDNKTKEVDVLMARGQAPFASTPDMYSKSSKLNSLASIFGGLAVTVPGTLRGYWDLHQKYGRLPWKFLIEPAVKICKDGVFVEPFTRIGLEQVEHDILHSKTLRQMLIDPFSGRVKTQRQKIFRPTLAKTLELVANEGPDVLYNGALTANFVKDIQNEGGIMTETDLANYRTQWLQPLKLNLNNLTIHTPPPPSCGSILLFIINALVKIGDKLKRASLIDQWFYIVEVWKHAYGFRSRLGDPGFMKNVPKIVTEILTDETAINVCSKISEMTFNDEKYYGGDFGIADDAGTSHFNFISPEGDAISITETISTLFGAMFRSLSTGIILNNTMGDFSIEDEQNIYGLAPFSANKISPGKIPLTSMVPTIITDEKNDLRLTIGGAGGPRIISAVSLVLVQHLLFDVCINDAVDMARLHHQLLPMELQYESDFSQELLHELKCKGHQAHPIRHLSVVSMILKDPSNNLLYAKGDLRRHCANDGF